MEELKKELNKIIDQKCSDNSLYALEGFTIFEEAIGYSGE
jgi:TrmH family RNA methyltransferase